MLICIYTVVQVHKKSKETECELSSVQGFQPTKPAKPETHTRTNLYPLARVRYFTGTGAGQQKLPMGYPCYSLADTVTQTLVTGEWFMGEKEEGKWKVDMSTNTYEKTDRLNRNELCSERRSSLDTRVNDWKTCAKA